MDSKNATRGLSLTVEAAELVGSMKELCELIILVRIYAIQFELRRVLTETERRPSV